MKVLFIVQGEGRGHMTQALALEEILISAGHEVTDVVIGTSNRRQVPGFFVNKTKARLHPVESPNFYFDKSHKSIDWRKTFFRNLFHTRSFVKELNHINIIVRKSKPDVIVNFYDILGGFYFLFYRPNIKRICLAHQYLVAHHEFPFADGYAVQKLMYHINNWLTSMGAHKRLALSFKDYFTQGDKLSVVPPLLRTEVLSITPKPGDYILAYVVNKGYGQEIINWHKQNPRVRIHCFWDNFEEMDQWSPTPNLTFHHINDQKFLKLMAGCAGYVSTAGFESICEAMYLGKPVMMVPVQGQYEQACNAMDAVKANAGIQMSGFDLSPFLEYMTRHKIDNSTFRAWTASTNHIMLKEIEAFIPMAHKKKPVFSWPLSERPLFSGE